MLLRCPILLRRHTCVELLSVRGSGSTRSICFVEHASGSLSGWAFRLPDAKALHRGALDNWLGSVEHPAQNPS